MSDSKSKRVGVVMGGFSHEREISLRTGAAVLKALIAKGYHAIKVDPKEDGLAKLSLEQIDVAFISLHGRYGEDGCIQGYLEMQHIPYTGSGVFSSALCYDKMRTKNYLKPFGVALPQHELVKKGDDVNVVSQSIKIKLPLIVKPNREGSTIGIKIVTGPNDLVGAINEALQFCDEVLIEEFIRGTEVTVGVLADKALALVEIAPKSGFYDYQAKYTAGMTEYFTPARINASLTKKIQKISEEIVARLDCRGSPRLDFIIDDRGDTYFLEINTIPGMTETSLLPKAAKVAGIEFDELCEKILLAARLD